MCCNPWGKRYDVHTMNDETNRIETLLVIGMPRETVAKTIAADLTEAQADVLRAGLLAEKYKDPTPWGTSLRATEQILVDTGAVERIPGGLEFTPIGRMAAQIANPDV